MIVFRRVVNRATNRDADAIAELHAASWQNSYRGILPDSYLDDQVLIDRQTFWRERFAGPLPTSLFCLLAFHHEHLVGLSCATLDSDPRWGTLLDNLHVHPNLKRQGIGRRLMRETAQWIVLHSDTAQMHLTVFADNREARAFYERMGGECVETLSVLSPGNIMKSVVRYAWDARSIAETEG